MASRPLLDGSLMANLITDLKRAWRLTKLMRSTDLSDEDALQRENIDTIYMEGCRGIRSDLVKTSEALCRDIEKARKSLTHEASTARKSLNRNIKTSRSDNDRQIRKLEGSLTNAVTKITELLESSHKASASRLGEVEETSKTTMDLVHDIREYVAKQAGETERWREGYDWRIRKSYILRVISTMGEIETQLEVYRKDGKSEGFIKDFDFLRETLEIHLEEEGLVAFAPKLGGTPDASNADSISSVIISENDQVVGTVAEVIHRGYEMDLGVEIRVIKKAQVSVYKNKETN
tara:strand:- start:4758 stop:5630 length:873 start_codon:yes stop_codon:yes gene_type:complete